ncbi:MAG: sulfotransferase [Pseudomonadota bacterium]
MTESQVADALQRVRARQTSQPLLTLYNELSALADQDASGLIDLECARWAIALREPARALAHIAKIRERMPPDDPAAAVDYEEGRALNNLGRLDAASACFERARNARPDWADAHAAHAHAVRGLGRADAALASYERALELDPDHQRALIGAAEVYAQRGEWASALARAERAQARAPDDGRLHAMRGQWLQSAGQPEAACEALQRATALCPADAAMQSALGSASQSAGRLEAAEQAYTHALELDPDLHPAAAALAGLWDLTGRTERARHLLDDRLAIGIPDPVLVLASANLSDRRQVDDDTLRLVLNAVAQPATPPHLSALLRFRVGDALDQRADYAAAFRHYADANAARRVRFDHDALARYSAILADRIARTQMRSRTELAATWRPIFIVGLPRSGTTLAEQILAAHPDVAAAGEVRHLALAAAAPAESELGSETVDAFHRRIGRSYRERMRATVGSDLEDAAFCTDKMWQNFEQLNLIHAAFPDAVIVHCTRHPMAVGWSIFQRSFGAAPPPFSTDLRDIAAYIGHHHRVMTAWRAIGAPATVELSYEALVDDLEEQVARLLGALGLAVHPNCLEFHAHKRVVTTESFGQVSRPIYRTAVDHWRAYAPSLAPLADGLAQRGIDPN